MKYGLWIAACSIAAGICGCGASEGNEANEAGDVTDVGNEIRLDGSTSYNLVGVRSGKCVDIAGASKANAARLDLASCNGNASQQFHVEAAGGGYHLRNANSNLCADVSGASTANGAAVIQYPCGTGRNQQWSFSNVGGGAQRLTALHSGKALDVTGGATNDGALLEQWTANGSVNQQFLVRAAGGGSGDAGAPSGDASVPSVDAGAPGVDASAPGVDAGAPRVDASDPSVDAGAPSGDAAVPGVGRVFAQNRFHFGTIDSKAKQNGATTIPQIDFFTSGWLLGDTFDHAGVCNDTKAGGALANQVPILVAYVSASHVKRADKTVCDCNVTSGSCVASNDLCHVGAQRISQDFSAIVAAYRSYSAGFASCYGTQRPIIFEMEPDWYQYTGSSQTQPWTAPQAGQMMSQLVAALKSSLPNALFSIDASPWVAPNNGADNGKQWYSNFDMSLFSFVNTSGGGTNANTAKIRSSNNMTWAGLSQVTGKPILADTGYGANGAPAGEDSEWNDPANINARMADGVIGISQYSPSASWGTTIGQTRDQLNQPKFNP